MMGSRSKMVRLVWPVRRMAPRLGPLARIRVRAAVPALVEAAGRHAGRLPGGAPRLARAADGDAVAVEDERAVGITARQRRDQPRIDR